MPLRDLDVLYLTAREALMNPDIRSTLRWTLASAAAWGALFAGVAASRAVGAGVSPLEHGGPIAVLGVIGATVGGLVGPLLQGLAARRRTPHRSGSESSQGQGGPARGPGQAPGTPAADREA